MWCDKIGGRSLAQLDYIQLIIETRVSSVMYTAAHDGWLTYIRNAQDEKAFLFLIIHNKIHLLFSKKKTLAKQPFSHLIHINDAPAEQKVKLFGTRVHKAIC